MIPVTQVEGLYASCEIDSLDGYASRLAQSCAGRRGIDDRVLRGQFPACERAQSG